MIISIDAEKSLNKIQHSFIKPSYPQSLHCDIDSCESIFKITTGYLLKVTVITEPVLWAVVSAPHSTRSGFGSDSIPPRPRWERARAQCGHRAVAPDPGGRLDQELPALSRHRVSSPSAGRWGAGGELTPAVRGWGRTRESVQPAHPPWSSPTNRPPAVA